MATKMVWEVGSGKAYTLVSTWITQTATDLTPATILVFAGTRTGALTDGASVTGATSGATGTVVGIASATQICIESIASGPFESGGEAIEIDGSNYFTSSGAGDSPIFSLEVSGTIAESSAISWTGFTADATNYIEMIAPSGERHDGTPGTGAGISCGNVDAHQFVINEDHCHFEYIEFDSVYTGANENYVVQTTSGNTGLVLHGNICTNSGGGAGCHGIRTFGTVRASCNLVVDLNTGFNNRDDTMTYYNNVVKDCTTGYVFNNHSCVASNNISFDCTTSWTTDGSVTGANNSATDAIADTPPGSTPVSTDLDSGDFNDSANDNMQPESGGTAEDAGWDGSGVFTVDNTGLTWPATWHVGAWSTVNGGGGVVPQLMYNYQQQV